MALHPIQGGVGIVRGGGGDRVGPKACVHLFYLILLI